MGYKSDVFYAVGWPNPEHAKEVLAVYVLDKRVQDHKIYKGWEMYDEGGPLIMLYYDEWVKWYDDFEDVQGVQRLGGLAEQFWRERGFPYAHKFVRIGEDVDDIDERFWDRGDEAQSIVDLFADIGCVNRHISNIELPEKYGTNKNKLGWNYA